MPITRMLPKAPGLRPTASAAFAPTKPTPIPAPAPANARGKVLPRLPVRPVAASANKGSISAVIFVFAVSVVGSFRRPLSLDGPDEKRLNAPTQSLPPHDWSTVGCTLHKAA